jgi:hypothetical protein
MSQLPYGFNVTSWKNGKLDLKVGGLPYNWLGNSVPLHVSIVLSESVLAYLGLTGDRAVEGSVFSATVNGAVVSTSVSKLNDGIRLLVTGIPTDSPFSFEQVMKSSVSSFSSELLVDGVIDRLSLVINHVPPSSVKRSPLKRDVQLKTVLKSRSKVSLRVDRKLRGCQYRAFLRSRSVTKPSAGSGGSEVGSRVYPIGSGTFSKKGFPVHLRLPKFKIPKTSWIEAVGMCSSGRSRFVARWANAAVFKAIND